MSLVSMSLSIALAAIKLHLAWALNWPVWLTGAPSHRMLSGLKYRLPKCKTLPTEVAVKPQSFSGSSVYMGKQACRLSTADHHPTILLLFLLLMWASLLFYWSPRTCPIPELRREIPVLHPLISQPISVAFNCIYSLFLTIHLMLIWLLHPSLRKPKTVGENVFSSPQCQYWFM